MKSIKNIVSASIAVAVVFSSFSVVLGSGWKESEQKELYFYDDDGNVLTGLQEIDGEKYFFESDGRLSYFWHFIDGYWYYFDSEMVFGWNRIEGNWYYFDSTGKMVTRWRCINGLWYYFEDSGTMVTGWKYIDGSWYCFDSYGVMKAAGKVSKNSDNTCMGISSIASPEAPEYSFDKWSGSYVYFGKYDGKPIKFRVLAPQTTAYGGTTMFLDSDAGIFDRRFDRFDHKWEDCELRRYLNGEFYNDSFTTVEKAAIHTSYLKGGDTYPRYSFEDEIYKETVGLNDKIFLLDIPEVSNPEYGYYAYSDTSNVKCRVKYDSLYDCWWLRSAGSGKHHDPWNDKYYAGSIDSVGCLERYPVTDHIRGVAPALNLDISTILFSSSVNNIFGKVGAEYKLTMLDDKLSISSSGVQMANSSDGLKICVTYNISGSDAGTANSATVLILDKEYKADSNAKILYYSVLEGEFKTNSYGAFTLPSSLSLDNWGTGYHVYILAEKMNNLNETDYASIPCEIAKPGKWIQDNNGWWFISADGSYPYSCWKQINGKWYYFDAKGYMVTGWKAISGKTYRFNSKGEMLIGWQYIDNLWYFFDDSGKMVTGWVRNGSDWYYMTASTGARVKGWIKISGKWYYFDPTDAKMVTGWISRGGKLYYFDESGVMQTGWRQIDDNWYYFKYDGSMASSEYVEGYCISSDGTWTNKAKAEWKKDSTGWYYHDSTGWYAKDGIYTIDGHEYEFDSSGYWNERKG